MFCTGIYAIHLLLHVIHFQVQDTQSINCPCRRFGIDGCIRKRLNTMEFCPKIGINLLNQIRSILIGFVNSSFKQKGFLRINIWVTNNVFQMPLYGIYPILLIKIMLNSAIRIRVIARLINVVSKMIVFYWLMEDLVSGKDEISHLSLFHLNRLWLQSQIDGCLIIFASSSFTYSRLTNPSSQHCALVVMGRSRML